MKEILCFGDSNTYGVNPENNERFGRDERWTGILQNLLGQDFYVIEDGYRGRSTCFADDSDPYRSAIKVLEPVLKTHSPLDLIVIMLGTNDFKAQFNMTAKVSGYALKRIVDKIHNYYGEECPKILLVSPIMMGEGWKTAVFGSAISVLMKKSKRFQLFLKKLLDKQNQPFLLPLPLPVLVQIVFT